MAAGSSKGISLKECRDEDALARPPKGYTDDNPAIEYLKLKSFIVMRKFKDAEALSATFLKQLLKTYEPVKGLV